MQRAMMIDLETLAKTPLAVFPVLGWCAFDYDPYGAEGIGHSGDIVINPQDCIDIGMEVDWSTLGWWLAQPEAAREQLGNPGKVQSLQSALKRFADYYADFGCKEIWSKGSHFDIPILESAYRLSDMETPWNYRAPRDVRTYIEAADIDDRDGRPKELVSHIASHDAIWQAKTVIKASKVLAEWREN